MSVYRAVETRGAGAFIWGEADCLTFCANVVKDLTGHDYMAEFRGYRGKYEAIRLLKKLGGIEAAVTRQLGAPVLPVRLRRGDVALADLGQGDALGVVCGINAAFKDFDGVGFLPMSEVRKGWRIE